MFRHHGNHASTRACGRGGTNLLFPSLARWPLSFRFLTGGLATKEHSEPRF